MNTVRDMFYFVEDVMGMLGLSRSASYKIIKKLNDELEKQDIFTINGRVSRRYFNHRFGLVEAESASTKNVVSPKAAKSSKTTLLNSDSMRGRAF